MIRTFAEFRRTAMSDEGSTGAQVLEKIASEDLRFLHDSTSKQLVSDTFADCETTTHFLGGRHPLNFQKNRFFEVALEQSP